MSESGRKDPYRNIKRAGLYVTVCRRCLSDWHVVWGGLCRRCGIVEPSMRGFLRAVELLNPGRPAHPEHLVLVRPNWPRYRHGSPQDRDEPFDSGGRVPKGERITAQAGRPAGWKPAPRSRLSMNGEELYEWPVPSANAELRRN